MENIRFVLSAFIRYYEILKWYDAKSILASQHYREQVDRAVDYAQEVEGVNLIIDSGAFSIWNKGGTLDLQDYIDFLKNFEKNHLSKFNEVWYVNLDVIPGKQGDKFISTEQVRQAADDGFDNYLKMRNEGWDNIIHVFHQGESVDVLDRLLDTDPEYVGISPSNDSMTAARKIWLTEAFNHIKQKKGYVKTHGFAVTSIDLMNAFPWFSVDSTSWFMIGMYGKLCIPLDKRGQVITDEDSIICDKFEISLSERKKNSKDSYNYIYLHNRDRAYQIDKYMDYLYKKYQLSRKQLCSHRNEGRVAANLAMFLRFEHQAKPDVFKPVSMFG